MLWSTAEQAVQISHSMEKKKEEKIGNKREKKKKELISFSNAEKGQEDGTHRIHPKEYPSMPWPLTPLL